MKNIKKILLWLTIISFGVLLLSSIPLFINYFKSTTPRFPIFNHLHVWFGVLFVVVVIIRIFINRNVLKSMLK